MKYCIDCKYLVRDTWCNSPNNGISVVNNKPNVLFAVLSRKNEDMCGKNAVFFELKENTDEIKNKKWYQFWK